MRVYRRLRKKIEREFLLDKGWIENSALLSIITYSCSVQGIAFLAAIYASLAPIIDWD